MHSIYLQYQVAILLYKDIKETYTTDILYRTHKIIQGNTITQKYVQNSIYSLLMLQFCILVHTWQAVQGSGPCCRWQEDFKLDSGPVHSTGAYKNREWCFDPKSHQHAPTMASKQKQSEAISLFVSHFAIFWLWKMMVYYQYFYRWEVNNKQLCISEFEEASLLHCWSRA